MISHYCRLCEDNEKKILFMPLCYKTRTYSHLCLFMVIVVWLIAHQKRVEKIITGVEQTLGIDFLRPRNWSR